MRKEYGFSKAKKNAYARQLKQQVTIRLDRKVVEYFKSLSEETEIPYQTLINLYLLDCVNKERKISLRNRVADFAKWKAVSASHHSGGH